MKDLIEDFEALLTKRDELRESHRQWCEDVNGTLGYGESSYEARMRDNVYEELQDVEYNVKHILATERATEEGISLREALKHYELGDDEIDERDVT